MQRFLTSLTLLLALGLSVDQAMALGFGRITATTTLGQPLNFVIALRLDPDDSIEAACIKADVSLGDRSLPDGLVRTRLETAAATGERRIRVTTTVAVDEPVVSVGLRLGCTTSLSRSFVVFADPPMRQATSSGNETDADTWVERSDSPVGSVLSAVPSTPAASVPTRGASQPARKRHPGTPVPEAAERRALAASARELGPDAGAAAAARTAAARAKAKPKPSGGSVLRLDPVEADALIAPSLQMSTLLSQAPDAAASGTPHLFADPEQEQRSQDQSRLKAMESALLKLRNDSQASEKRLTDMQQRMHAAEAGRYANPVVYGLMLLCILLAAGLAAMAWLRRRDRLTAAWWNGPAADATAAPPEPVADGVSAPLPAIDLPPPPAPRAEPRMSSFAPVPALTTAPLPESDASVIEPRRPMSAEELIDLEQQAEFFVVLGQDDAAIDLLMGHVRSTGGVSPLPYLKLLEIYRRRGEREPYDRIRERFNRRFNAYAPEWDVDPEMGLDLDGYPEVMGKLQRAWGRPSQSMELLDAALFRRDAGPTFDVPAYRELLFLYSMARDLAERDVSPEGVDLLLPFGDEELVESTFTTVEASPAIAAPAPSTPPDSFTLDLDVSTDQPPRLSPEDPDFKRSRH